MFLADRIEVLKVQEVEFCTARLEDGKTWQHYVHVVDLSDNRRFCLDLTGLQFGPEWPLLQAWDSWIESPNLASIESVAEFGHSRAACEEATEPANSPEYEETRAMNLMGVLLRRRPQFPPHRAPQPGPSTSFDAAARNAMRWYERTVLGLP